MDKDTDDAGKRVEWLHSEQYSAAGNISGEPQKTTRIGDEYQTQIPSLMTKNERFHLMSDDDQNIFQFGLPVPVTWVHNQHKNNEDNIEILNILFLVPCSSGEESWSAIEHDSFILGLYIFGKNLHLVNEFMGNKGMRNVISYYYGKFYRSNEHQKWSTYRKKRISKSLPGKKIFNGWRLHELLSRLLSNVTDKCKASLTQVIRSFEEGKLSFEEYVFALRDTMGIDLLIQAVAIGEGKQDLTVKTRTRLRSKKVESTCASLKTEEIVNIVKDRIGLSKARLNVFFWAAVWSRLLARGWHSEQLKNYGFQKSKNLVFLAPGVTKFSRRSLVKGIQYFESVTEVLNKVASELQLLEDEREEDPLVEPHATHGSHGSDDEQDLMKCTVVDTSFVEVVTVKEVTSLTVSERADMQASTSVSGETDYDEDMINLDHDRQPGRKLRFIFKQRTKSQQLVESVKNDNSSGEDVVACSEKKRPRIMFNLNNNNDNKNRRVVKPLILSENGQRQSRRNRALTAKALEALADGLTDPKKRGTGPGEGTRRRVRAKMASVSSCGGRYLGDGVFDGSSQMVNESPK